MANFTDAKLNTAFTTRDFDVLIQWNDQGAQDVSDEMSFAETATVEGGTPVTYFNRVFDSVAGKFVSWLSEDSYDVSGAEYPGPGTFGADTSDYVFKIVS